MCKISTPSLSPASIQVGEVAHVQRLSSTS